MNTIATSLLVLYGTILIITPLYSFPQSRQKLIQLTISLSIPSYIETDISTGSPNIVSRIDNEERDGQALINPKPKPRCAVAGGTFCVKSDTYPTDYVNSLVAKGILTIKGFEDVLDFNLTKTNDPDDETATCESVQRIVAPTEGKTESGDWFYIVNTDTIKQKVRVEECFRNKDIHNAHSKCSFLSFGAFEMKCEQKYILRKMVGLDGGLPKEMDFQLPSCCVCTVLNSRRPKQKLEPSGSSQQLLPETKPAKSANFSPVASNTIPIPKKLPYLGTSVAQPACNKSTYCEKISNYPTDHVKMLIHMDLLKDYSLFKNDTKPLAVRKIHEDSGISLCDFSIRTVYPEAGRTKNNDWETIIQFVGDETYKQGVHLELCKSKNADCKFADKRPSGYKTTCKQKYVYREMLSISKESGEPKLNQFKFASCCACYISLSTSVTAKLGIPDPKPTTPPKLPPKHSYTYKETHSSKS